MGASVFFLLYIENKFGRLKYFSYLCIVKRKGTHLSALSNKTNNNMKAQECTLVVNARNGYIFTPIKCKSINEAVRMGKEGMGFAYRVIVKGKGIVRRGFCD